MIIFERRTVTRREHEGKFGVPIMVLFLDLGGYTDMLTL